MKKVLLDTRIKLDDYFRSHYVPAQVAVNQETGETITLAPGHYDFTDPVLLEIAEMYDLERFAETQAVAAATAQ